MRTARSLAVVAALCVVAVAVAQDPFPNQAPEELEAPQPAFEAAADEDVGETIEVGPSRGSDDRRLDRQERRGRLFEGRRGRPPFGESRTAVSRYMIGIGGSPLPPEVRAHVDLPDDQGVLVRVVDPNGPAAEAGVQLYDIVVRADGKPIRQIGDLAGLVGARGEAGGSVELELLRRGRLEQVVVTPVERPIDEFNPLPRRRFGGRMGNGRLGELLDGQLGQQLGQLLNEEALEEALNQEGGLGELLNEFTQQRSEQHYQFSQEEGDVAIHVRREPNGPAQLTVTRGEQTWEFSSDDIATIEALPEGVRELVDRVLRGDGQPFDFQFQSNPGGMRLQLGELRERIQQMEQQAEALREQLEEAPPFQPPAEAEAEEDVEIELPAE